MTTSPDPRDRLPSTRKGAIEWYRNLIADAARKDAAEAQAAAAEKREPKPSLARQVRRWLARNDLFYLLVFALKRRDMNHNWLFARCREVARAPNGYLDLWAREHYKSTVITFGLSIQDILASHGANPEPRYGGRETTIGILSFNRPSARGFLRQIKQELETNKELQADFPDVLWQGSANEIQRAAPKWSEDDGLIVKRKTNPKEATVEAHGLIDGQPTGKHYFTIVYDDVVTIDTVRSPEMIKKATEAWELSINLGTDGGWVRYIGTRYHLFDTYRTMMDRGIPARTYPCTSDGSEDFTKGVLRSPEFLAERRRTQGPYTFGAQMLLNPTADKAQGFDSLWLRYWPAAHKDGLNVYMIVDPASKKKKTSDYTSAWVLGVDGSENWMILDKVRDRLNLVQRQKMVFALHRKWRPLKVGYEEYGLQADIEHIKFVQELENYRFTITPLGGSLAKEDRIKRLVPVFEQGRIFLPDRGILRTNHEGQRVDVIKQFIEEEYTGFPVIAHDDSLDSLSRFLDPEMNVTAPEPPPPAEEKWKEELYAESQSQNWMYR